MTSITSLKTKVKTKVKKLTVLFGSAAVMALGMNASAMAATMYDVTDLGDLAQRLSFDFSYGINDAGQVVGSSGFVPNRAFLWNSSTGMTDLGTLPGGRDSYAYGINNAGQVVGSSDGQGFLWTRSTGMTALGTSGANAINNAGQVVGGENRAFLWSSSTGSTDLGTLPGGSSSRASDINDNSQVVGTSSTSDGTSHAFLWNSSTGMTDLGTLPNKNSSSASAINNAGQVVGNSGSTFNGRRAFLWSSSTGMVDLGLPPGRYPASDSDSSSANDINDLGQVVGSSDSTFNGRRAFLWSSDTGMVELNTLIDPGIRLDTATAINNKGQIVANSRVSSYEHRTYLLTPKSSTPVPEPLTTGGTILAGAGLVYLRRRYGRLHRSQNKPLQE
jgi:probable HAF family extracellular repeat protein